MSMSEIVKASNSWHWLAVVVTLSAAASVFVPKFGWRDVFACRRNALEPAERKAEERLAKLMALDEAEADAAHRQAEEAKRAREQACAEFASYGVERMPEGENSVFEAQGRVGAALAKRGLRIVSNDASLKSRDGKPKKKVSSKEPFSTAETEYRAVGDFRDVFMFFVGETHVRANYSFRDISARHNDGGSMDLAFTLQVFYR